MKAISNSEMRLSTLIPWRLQKTTSVKKTGIEQNAKKTENTIEEKDLFQVVIRTLMASCEDNEPAAFIVQNGKIKFFFNDVFEKISGYNQKYFIKNKTFINLISLQDFGAFIDNFKCKSNGSSSQTFKMQTMGGDLKQVELTSILVNYKNNRATLNFLNDITERKHTKEFLIL